jgi:hypothetical protein
MKFRKNTALRCFVLRSIAFVELAYQIAFQEEIGHFHPRRMKKERSPDRSFAKGLGLFREPNPIG